MNGIFSNLLNALVEIWKSIGIAQKVSIILVGVLSVLATGIILYIGSRPDWAILYSGLDGKTAAKICDIVKDNNVELKLSNAGKTILVPSKDVYKLRLKVAAEGIEVAKNGVGWELFDKMKLGMTDRQQRIAFQRAIQGELERMISEMPAVATCKVMLTLPKKRIFRRDSVKPSASIMLVLQNNRALSMGQVNSIRYMVASAVSGMEPKNVTIVDNHGESLARQESGTGLLGSEATHQLDLQRRTEEMIKNKAEAILRPVIGSNKIVAVVSCDMVFDNVDKVIEQYQADQSVVVSEKVVTEDTDRTGKSSRNNAIADSEKNGKPLDIKIGNPKANLKEEKATEQRKTSERTYIVPKTVQKVSQKGGRIKQMTVAVSIGQKSDKESWSKEEMAKFKELVSAAVGLDNYPGSKVTVSELKFHPVPKEPELKPPVMKSVLSTYDELSSSALVRPIIGLVLLFVLYKVFKKNFQATAFGGDNVEGEDINGQALNEVEENLAVDLLETLQEQTTASPQQVATVMESWLSLDEGLK